MSDEAPVDLIKNEEMTCPVCGFTDCCWEDRNSGQWDQPTPLWICDECLSVFKYEYELKADHHNRLLKACPTISQKETT